MAEKKKKKKVATKKKTEKIKAVTTNKKKEETKKDTANKVLLVIFLILCVVVFVLATIMITESANGNNNKYDIRVPITEKELSDGIDIKINMDDVSKNQSKEYRIQVTNYIDDTINSEVMKYKMNFSTSNKNSKIDIELYSSKDSFELLEGKKKITDLNLKKDKKEKITYTLKLTPRTSLKTKEYVKVNITEDK